MRISFFTPASLLAAASALSIAVEPLTIPWYTIDGGSSRSTSDDGRFVLSGTIGQPDAGEMTGGVFKLAGGFWYETPPGDCNVSGTVDLRDHTAFVDCMSGPAADMVEGCECFDLDGDGNIGLADFAEYQTGFVGE